MPVTGPLGDAEVELNLDLDHLRRQVRTAVKETGKGGEQAGKEFGDGFSRGSDGKLRDRWGRLVNEGGKAGRDAGKRAGDGFSIGFGQSFAAVFKIEFAKAALSAALLPAKLPVLGAAFGAVGAAAAAAAVGVGQFAAALAPVVGFVALLPAALLTAGAVVGTLKVATSGLGDAFKAATKDQKAFDEVTKNLSVAGRALAAEFRALHPSLIAIRNDVQQVLFGPLVGQMTALAAVLAGPVRDGMRGVAEVAAQAALNVARFGQQAESVSAVRGVFSAARDSLSGVTAALVPLLGAFRSLSVVALPVMVRLSEAAGLAAQSLGQAGIEAAASGRALSWIETALATFVQIRDVLGGVAAIIGTIARAAGGGSGILAALAGTLERVNAALKAPPGSDSMANIFASLRTVLRALEPLLGTVLGVLGDLAPVFAQVAVAAVPAVDAFVRLVRDFFQAAGPGLAAGFTELAKVFNQLATSGAVSTLGGILGGVASFVRAVGDFLVAALPGINVFLSAISTTFTTLVDTGVFQQLGKVFSDLLVAVSPLLPVLGDALARIVIALVPLLEAFVKVIADPEIQRSLIRITEGLVRILEALVPLIEPLIKITGILLRFPARFFALQVELIAGAVEGVTGLFGKLFGASDDWARLQALTQENTEQFVNGMSRSKLAADDFANQAVLRFGDTSTAYSNLARVFGDSAAVALLEANLDRVITANSSVQAALGITGVAWDTMWTRATSTAALDAARELDLISESADRAAEALLGTGNAWQFAMDRLAENQALDVAKQKADDLADALRTAGRVFDTVSTRTAAGGSSRPNAQGGIYSRPTTIDISEYGQKEVVIPVTRPGRAVQLARESGLIDILTKAGAFPVGQAVGGPVTTTINAPITVQSNASDPELVAYRTAARLARWAVRLCGWGGCRMAATRSSIAAGWRRTRRFMGSAWTVTRAQGSRRRPRTARI